ncbi:MAG: hypothetical protein ABFS56_32395 [Pseudomonadota bacterium]
MKRWLLFLLIWSSEAMPASLEGYGSCEAKFFSLPQTGKIKEEAYSTVVLRDGVPVFSADNAIIKTLNFNTTVFILQARDDQFQVQEIRENAPHLGWVAREDLLCAKKPLKSSNGFPMRFYPLGKAYHNYRGITCKRCPELSPARDYFVFEKRNGRYLLGTRPRIRPKTTGLIGWVDSKNGHIWNTVYSLRPKGKRFCAYRNRRDTRHCIPIQRRIPVLAAIRDDFYQVLLPSSHNEGYVRVSPDVQLDVLVTSRQLRKYEYIFQKLADKAIPSDRNFRRNFVNALKASLEYAIKKPLQLNSSETLETILKRSGKLPIRTSSPLFRYRLKDLLRVPDSELRRLHQWLGYVAEFLRIIQKEQAPVIYDKRWQKISPDKFSLSHSSFGEIKIEAEGDVGYGKENERGAYWIPQEFLP